MATPVDTLLDPPLSRRTGRYWDLVLSGAKRGFPVDVTLVGVTVQVKEMLGTQAIQPTHIKQTSMFPFVKMPGLGPITPVIPKFPCRPCVVPHILPAFRSRLGVVYYFQRTLKDNMINNPPARGWGRVVHHLNLTQQDRRKKCHQMLLVVERIATAPFGIAWDPRRTARP